MGIPNNSKNFTSEINFKKEDIVRLLKETLSLKEDSLNKVMFNHQEFMNIYRNNPEIISNLSHLDLDTLQKSFNKVYTMIEENKSNLRETSGLIRYFFKNEKFYSEQTIGLFILLVIVMAIKIKTMNHTL